jgi:CheY-like chemotaxis protein
MSILTQSRSILVADDHSESLALLEMLFEMEGHTVFCAEDGTTAIKLAEEHIPDVVMLDLKLPKIDGLQVGKVIRANPALDHSVLVAHTGATELTEQTDQIGFDYYALKPVEPSLLFELAYAPRQNQLILLSQALIQRSVDNMEKGKDLTERSRVARERSRNAIERMTELYKKREPFQPRPPPIIGSV